MGIKIEFFNANWATPDEQKKKKKKKKKEKTKQTRGMNISSE